MSENGCSLSFVVVGIIYYAFRLLREALVVFYEVTLFSGNVFNCRLGSPHKHLNSRLNVITKWTIRRFQRPAFKKKSTNKLIIIKDKLWPVRWIILFAVLAARHLSQIR
jgi:hypothetical protein